MAENNTQQTQPTEGDQNEAPKATETVSKEEYEKLLAQSRKWEQRSKDNAAKAKKYDELAAQSMTDAEKLDAASKRADEAEAKLAQYEAETQRAKDAADVSAETGVPANLLTATGKEAMKAQAESILSFAKGQPSAPIFKSDGSKPGAQKKTPQDSFADFFSQISN